MICDVIKESRKACFNMEAKNKMCLDNLVSDFMLPPASCSLVVHVCITNSPCWFLVSSLSSLCNWLGPSLCVLIKATKCKRGIKMVEEKA